jgi:hypothetical protein
MQTVGICAFALKAELISYSLLGIQIDVLSSGYAPMFQRLRLIMGFASMRLVVCL